MKAPILNGLDKEWDGRSKISFVVRDAKRNSLNKSRNGIKDLF